MCPRWATAPRSRPMTMTICAWWRTTCRRSCAHPGSAACRHCRTPSPMKSDIDELATEAGVDPIEYRLRYLSRFPRHRSRQRRRRARRLEAAPGAAGAGHRGRHRARTRFCLRIVCPQQVSGLWRGVVGLDCRRRREQGDRRCQRDARGRGAGFRPDDQPGRRSPPDPGQRHPVDQPRADGTGFVRPRRR